MFKVLWESRRYQVVRNSCLCLWCGVSESLGTVAWHRPIVPAPDGKGDDKWVWGNSGM